MKEILILINNFEKRNNISISVVLHGDGSGSIQEFWDYDEIKTFENEEQLIAFLSIAELEKDTKDNRVHKPIKIVKE